MNTHHYKFNPESLSYDKVTTGVKHMVLKTLSVILASVAIACGFYIVYTSFFESPKERKLKRELEQMQIQYDLISKKMDQVEVVLNDLQQRDDNIYRTIFEATPIPTAVREAGFGDINRYKELEGYDNSALMTQLSERVDKITKQLYIQSKSYDEVIEKAQNKDALWAATPAIQPVAQKDLKYISSGFGMRMHPIYKIMRFHYGIDLSAPTGSDVYATAMGKVVETDTKGRTGNGLKIVIDHGFGYKTYYAHLSKIYVKEGQAVQRGQVIGLVGNTGISTGPHLHYEVHKNGTAVNPANYFFNDLSPDEFADITDISARMGQSLD